MTDRQHRVSIVLALIALLGVGALYIASLSASDSFGNLLVGIASSIAAVAFYTLAEAAARYVSYRRMIRLFGPELVKGQTIFVLPDFVVDESLLVDGTPPSRALRRGSKEVREQLIPLETRDLGMGSLRTYAGADIEATLLLASTLGELGNPTHRILSDQEIVARQTEPGALFFSESFISVGFSSNDVTLAYAYDTTRSMLGFETFQAQIDERPQLAFRVGGGEVYTNSPTAVWGTIIRYGSSDPSGRRFFICGGLSSKGTTAAARYLALQWRELGRRAPDGDFIAVVTQANDGATEPRLVRVHPE